MKRQKPYSTHLRVLSLVLATLLCVTGSCCFLLAFSRVSAVTKDATVTAMEAKLKEIQNNKSKVASQISAAKNDKAKAAEYKSYIDDQINLVTEEIDTIDTLIAELNEQILTKETEITETTQKIDAQYGNFRQILRLQYEEGDASYIEMVLGASDFYDFLVRVEHVGALMEYASTLMTSLRQNRENLKEAKAVLEESKAAQETYADELKTRKEELDLLQAQNEEYLNKLANDISAYQNAYNSYAKAEKEEDAKIEAYLKELQAKENKAFVGGDFIWPLPAKNRTISSGYGWRTLNGVKEFHQGIDIPAPKGTNIYASAAGTVVTATSHYSYGNYVLIDHGGGMATLYAHASKLNVKKGDTVKQGDVIAFVGTTGYSTGNHTHFEVRVNGTRTDPLKYVKQP